MDIDGQVIENEAQEPTYYARIPNMAIDDLDVYQLALYCNYKRTAAEDGTCYKSNATLAQETGMSISKIKTTRAFLQKKGYIKVKHHIIIDENGKKIENAPPTITIINVWEKNHKRYSNPRHEVTAPPSPDNYPPRHEVTAPPSPDNPKEDHSKKNSKEEKSATPKSAHSNGDAKGKRPIPQNYAGFEHGNDAALIPYLEAWQESASINGIKPPIPSGQRRKWLDDADSLREMGCTSEMWGEYIRSRKEAKKSTVWTFALGDVHQYLAQKQNQPKPAPKRFEPQYIKSDDVTMILVNGQYQYVPGDQRAAYSNGIVKTTGENAHE